MPRARSFWAWGWADKFPDDDARRAIAEHAMELLGFRGLELRELPSIERIAMPEPRLRAQAHAARHSAADAEADYRAVLARVGPGDPMHGRASEGLARLHPKR